MSVLPDEDASRCKCSLFVRQIPSTATDEEFLNFFSNIGPVRSCFIVKPKNDTEAISKPSYGFVRFVTQEDAQKAIETVKTMKFKDSKLVLESALKKRTFSDEKSVKKQAVSTETNATSPRALPIYKLKKEKSPQIFITGLPASIEKKQLFKKLKKYGTIVSLEHPFNDDSITCAVTYSSLKDVSLALPRISNHVFKGSKMQAFTTPEQLLKSHRLIVRNLKFNTTEDDLRNLFINFGSIVEIHCPKKPDNRISGYGFVQFLKRTSAIEAVSKLKETTFNGRKIKIDYAISKADYEKTKENQNPEKKNQVKDPSSDRKLGDESADQGSSNLDAGNNIKSEDDTEEVEDDEENESIDCLSDGSDSAQEDFDSGKGNSFPAGKSHALCQSDDKTLFVRNLLFETNVETLQEKFSKFGSLLYIKLVKDSLGRSRGCAFVSFVKKEDADRCLEAFEESYKLPSFTDGSFNDTRTSKISEKLYHEIGSEWNIDGRQIDVLRAIPKMAAQEISKKTAEEKKQADKRNLYLLKESYVDLNPSTNPDMSESDRQKRQKANQERTLKLKNLNCFVSKTRVSIRNMPTSIDEKKLKDIIKSLITKTHPEFKPSSRYVKQVKIMRDKDRRSADGMPRSLGYAFVEFADHKYALSLVRKMNNRDDIFTAKKRPIVEFAIENATILEKRKARGTLDGKHKKANK